MIISQALLRAMREGVAWMAGRRQRVRVVGRSMEPTLAEGDFVLVDRSRQPRIGQIVVAYHPRRRDLLVVKRLQALEQGRLFLVGDNPTEGTDSRSWGPIESNQMVGVVTLVLDRPTTGPDLDGAAPR